MAMIGLKIGYLELSPTRIGGFYSDDHPDLVSVFRKWLLSKVGFRGYDPFL